MPATVIDPSRIPGWGIDADPRNDPTYPMRDRSRDDSPGMNWSRPPLQEPDVEVLRSIEHNRLPAVMGMSTPPRGLSGAIRRMAFRYSESQWAHWLMLMGADRVNVVEGLFQDLRRGKIPNIFAEMGLGTELKHNRKNFLTRLVMGFATAFVLAFLLTAWLD
ncbi:MAG TPA: hypothetical protein VD929_04400 [Caulobacteraceae bacterium]|nr:hypothetical protein [Caulobacteraceae bacterium]